jgi:CRP-like cAMP-binding protein
MKTFKVKADAALQAALAAHASGTTFYEAGDFIFAQGEEASGVCLVASGSVRIFVQSKREKALMERLATPGCVLGLPATIGGEPYTLTAQAIERTELIHVSRLNVIKLLQDAALAIKILSLLSCELGNARIEMAKSNSGRNLHRTAASGQRN